MRIVVVNLHTLPELQDPVDLLRRFRIFGPWSEALLSAAREAGGGDARVVAVQRFSRDAVLQRNGVTYRFVHDGGPAGLPWWRSSPPAVAVTIDECRRARRRGQPCIVHINNLDSIAVVWRLGRWLPKEVPIVVQHHAERPRTGLSGLLQRRALARASAFVFAARGSAGDWIEGGAIRRDAPIHEVMEGSTLFTHADRGSARRVSGMDGSPVILWVGRLDANKDPMTVLVGLEAVLAERPEARLHMAYGPDSPLLGSVEERIARSDVLGRAVRMLGTVEHGEMEAVYNSADYFVLGSHYEGSGFALAEALACGVVPVVTDIPSFRMMTDGGGIGALWRPGQPGELAAALAEVLARPLGEQSLAARDFFDRRLSYPAIGKGLVEAYSDALRRVGGG